MKTRFSEFLKTTTALCSIARFRSVADFATRSYRSRYSAFLRLKPVITPTTGVSWSDTKEAWQSATLERMRQLSYSSVVNYLRPSATGIPFLWCQYAIWLRRLPARGS